MLGNKKILKNNRGAILLVVLFVLILLVGLAYALTIVSITTYQATQNDVAKQQATYEAKSAAQVISNQMLQGTAITSNFVNQLNSAGANGQLTGTYRYANDSQVKGQFEIYYPYPDNKNIIHITVTTVVGEVANSVTTVLRGEPKDIDTALDDYNLYLTSPNGTYSFQYMRAGGGVLTLYISTDQHGSYLRQLYTFPYEGTNSLLTISGSLTMDRGTYNATTTAYGNLTLRGVNINGNVFVRDNTILSRLYENPTYYYPKITGNLMTYGNVTMNIDGGTRDTFVVTGSVTAGGQVAISNGRVGSITNRSNVTLNNANTLGINSQGSLMSITSSIVGGNIYSSGDVIINGSTINGGIYVKGKLTLINSTVNGSVVSDGNVDMNASTITGNLNTKSDLTITGSTLSKVLSNCIIDGKLTTSGLGSGYHEFGTLTTHVLSIKQPTKDWDRGELAVVLLSVKVAGIVKTAQRVVFMDDGTVNSGKKSIIHTLYVQHHYVRYGSPSSLGNWMRLWGTEITNFYLVDSAGAAKDMRVHDSTITNLFCNNILATSSITQPAGGKWDCNSAILGDGAYGAVNVNGDIYSLTTIRFNQTCTSSASANLYAPTGLTVPASALNRLGNYYAGGTLSISGNIGSLILASSTGSITIPAGVTVNGDIKSIGSTAVTVNGIVTGSVYTQGAVSVGGTISGNIKTASTVTVNSGAVIGSSSANQLYSTGLTDNGGATINASVYNNSSSHITVNSNVGGYIYTLGNITINNSATAVGGYVKANGTGTSYIKRSVNGNIHVGGTLNMYDSNYTGLTVTGNVKATHALFYGTVVTGNVHATGSGMAIQLESAHIRGSAHAQATTGNMRLGGNCTIGLNLTGAYTARTAVYCGGQLNFSAWNQAYGNVYCGNYLTQGTLEGSGNTIHGNLYANSSVLINHTSAASNAGVSSYQGIYSNGTVTIYDDNSANGTIAYVRGVGTINITNYTVTGEVFGPANVTLTNTPSYKVHPRDGSTAVDNWVKLLGNSPVTNDVWSSGVDFYQSEGSKIGGNLRVDKASDKLIEIKAAVQGNVYITNSGKVEVKNNLSYSAGVPRAVGGTLYADSYVKVGNYSSIGGNVSCYDGNIEIGEYSPVLGSVTRHLTAGGDLTKHVTIGPDSPISGGIGAKGNIITGSRSTVGGNVFSQTGYINLGANVGGSVHSLASIVNTTDGVTISGHLRADGTGTSIIRGSVFGNIYVNGPLTVTGSGGSGTRRLGTTTANTIRCNGAFSSSVQYIIKGSINNITGNMIIDNTVEGSVECPNGVLTVTGNVGGTVRTWNTTTVTENIGGHLYVFSDGTKVVTIGGTIGGNATIKGDYIQGGAVYGNLLVQGGYTPNGIYIFGGALSINGDLTLNFGANNGQLGGVGTDINVTGTLTINVNNTNYVNVYGRIICGNLRVNRTNNVTDIIDKAALTGWPGMSRTAVRFYADVHVQNNAYVLGATFYHANMGAGTGSSVFVGKHLAARDCSFYARGYTGENVISTNLSYGSVSVGYRVATAAGASAGATGSLITQGCTFYSRIQAKGNVHLYHTTVVRTGWTADSYQKMAHYIGGNLILEGSIIQGHGGQYPTYDTLTIVNGNCSLIYNTYPTYVGHPDATSRGGYKEAYEGLYVAGTLNVGSSCGVYVDVYAYGIVNNGTIQIGKFGRWGVEF